MDYFFRLVVPLRRELNAKGRRSRSGLRYQSETNVSCDESGVGFAACLAENSMPLWSHHSILQSDGTCHVRRSLLRGLAAGMERQPGRSAAVAQFGRVGCFGARQSFGLRRQASWPKVWRGGGCIFSATERAHKRNGGQVDGECRRPCAPINVAPWRTGLPC
jgi:hypothetical protein